MIFRLQQISQHFRRIAVNTTVFEEVQSRLTIVTSVLTEAETTLQPIIPSTSQSGLWSCTRLFEIPLEQLQYLLDWVLTTTLDIAQVFGVSQSAIKRRLREYGLSVSGRQTNITDAALGKAIRSVQAEFPNAGYRRVQYLLKHWRIYSNATKMLWYLL